MVKRGGGSCLVASLSQQIIPFPFRESGSHKTRRNVSRPAPRCLDRPASCICLAEPCARGKIISVDCCLHPARRHALSLRDFHRRPAQPHSWTIHGEIFWAQTTFLCVDWEAVDRRLGVPREIWSVAPLLDSHCPTNTVLGPVVRYAPNRLLFRSPTAIRGPF